MTATSVDTRILNVDLGDRRYPIWIGQNLLQRPALVQPYVKGRQVMIVTNDTVAPLYLEQTQQLFADFDVQTVVLQDGEQYKTMTEMGKIHDALLEHHFDRQCTLVALGGGVIGDITGFAAASYQRGVPFIQIPTTLLSQVDSSVGGKTGVNHPLGKNMIGAFHQPQAVMIDLNTLNTLDDRQLAAGMAEVIKYGLILDAGFYDWIKQHLDDLLAKDPEALARAIENACAIKAKVVEEDEKEAGKRALLNLGHTFGHAIESHMGYGTWLHGEAISAGMCQAAYQSQLAGDLSAETVADIQQTFMQTGLPTYPPATMSADDFLSKMAVDKKAQNGQIRLVLLHAIGDAYVTADYDETLLQKTLNEWQGTPA